MLEGLKAESYHVSDEATKWSLAMRRENLKGFVQ